MQPEADDVRVWLVERGYTNRDLIVLEYATPDGERVYRKELSVHAIDPGTVTAATDVSPEDLTPVEEADLRERYAAEASRMADEHEPDDQI